MGQTAAAKPRPASVLEKRARDRRDDLMQRAASILTKDGATTAERSSVDRLVKDAEAEEARRALFAEMDERASNRARVVREPLTYSRHSSHSYFADRVAAVKGDDPAKDRLKRHERELEVELRARANTFERRYRGDVAEPERTTFEKRAVIDSAGSPSFGTPPLWLIDLAATIPRPERVISDLCPSFPLPDGVASVNIPRLTAGGVEQPQSPAAADPAGEPWNDAATSSQCVHLSGHVDFPLQLLEQSPMGAASLDELVWRDLLSAWDADLEAQVGAGKGTGSNSELLGILNVEGINKIVFTNAAPTGALLFSVLGEAFGAVSDNRKVRPEAWVMRGGRWAYLATAEDKQEHPLSSMLDVQSPTAPVGPIGTLLGNCPVFTCETIPVNLGAGHNQDAIVALRPSDLLLWEGQPKTSIDRQALSGTMGCRIHLRAYAAFIASRYASSIATITGTGMVVATNE
jgi:HK97 family phage major capsid protein